MEKEILLFLQEIGTKLTIVSGGISKIYVTFASVKEDK